MDSTSLTYTAAALGAACIAYLATKSSTQIDPLYDFNEQSVEIDPVEHIRIAKRALNKPLIEYIDEDLRTLHDVLTKGIQISGNGDCLGYRVNGTGPYKWLSYYQVIDLTRFVGSGLLYKNIKPDNSTHIGIYSKNCAEWTVCEYACYSYSMVVVSLYDSYGKDSIKYILNQGNSNRRLNETQAGCITEFKYLIKKYNINFKAEINAVFVDGYARLLNIAHVVNELPYLRLIVYFDELTSTELLNINLPPNVELMSFASLLKLGRDFTRPPVPPTPSDVATLCYTSGTTGNPKGAMITHANIIANDAGFYDRLHLPHLNIPGLDSFTPSPIAYCYLPLAHMMERTNTFSMLRRGGKIGYMSGDLTKLPEDCQLLKPTDFTLVPRLINKLYDRVVTEIGHNKAKWLLLKTAIASKESDRKKGIIKRDTIYDKLIFKKIRDSFGGNIVRSATGSAPSNKAVFEFTRSAFACRLPEAYGQTESTCVITMMHPLEPKLGHCGPPLINFMVKLIDVPEMGYFAKDNKGEICAKGPSVFKGYYKDEEKTAEVIDKDGWLHTGDIGRWTENGCLVIIDRKKHIFKLSQGEYIAPERVEHVYANSKLISQIIVEGDSSKDFCVAIVVPEEEYVVSYCNKNGINGTFKELCANGILRELILKDMKLLENNSDLMQYERVKNIHILNEPFSIDNGYLTATMKLKRTEIRLKLKNIINGLYDELNVVKSKL